MHSSAAKVNPLSNRLDLSRASTIERINTPYMAPLYWKWM